jgi:hypothetical protein
MQEENQDDTGNVQRDPDAPNPVESETTDAAIASLTAALRQMLGQPPVEVAKKTVEVDKPIMGGLVEMPNGLTVAWCGTHPNSEWTGPHDSAPPNPAYPGQFRDTSITAAQKSHSKRIEGLVPKFKASDNRLTFEHKILEHLELHGLFSISCVPNPADTKTMITCVTNHPRLQVKMLPTLMAPQLTKYDTYDVNNDTEAKLFLLNSVDDSLATELRSVTMKEDPFPLYWLHLMKIVRNVSIDYCNTIKHKIRNRHPSQYPGQDLAQMAIDFRADVRELEIAGQYEHNLSLIILEAFLSAGGSQPLEEYKHSLRILHDKLEETLLDIGFLTQDDATARIIKEELTVRDICRIATDKYRNLASRGRWPPARHNPDSKAAPAKFGAFALVPQHQNAKTKKDGCFNCRSLEHMARDCPEPKKETQTTKKRSPDKQRRSNTNPKRHENRNPWKRTPPGPNDSPTKKVKDRTWFWCEKCGRWSTTHGTSEHKSPTNGEAKHQANLVMNHSAWHVGITPLPEENPVSTLLAFRAMSALPPSLVGLGLGLKKIPLPWLLAPIAWLIVVLLLLAAHRQHVRRTNAHLHRIPEPLPRWARRKGPAFTKHRKRHLNTAGSDRVVSQMRPWFKRHPPAPNRRRHASRDDLMMQRADARELQAARAHEAQAKAARAKDAKKTLQARLREFDDAISFRPVKLQASHEEREKQAPKQASNASPYRANCSSCDACRPNHFHCVPSAPSSPPPHKKRFWSHHNKTKPKNPQPMAPAMSLDELRTLANVMARIPRAEVDIQSAYLYSPLRSTKEDKPFAGTAHAYVAALSAPFLSIPAALKAAFTSPTAVRENLDKESQFKVIWDTGASISISPSRADFVGPIERPAKEMKIAGIHGQTAVAGVGTVAWSFTDHDGMLRTLKVPALLVPSSKVRLLSINSLLNTYPDETIHHDKLKMTLSGANTSEDEPTRRGITVYICSESNLPSTTAYSRDTDSKIHQALNASISCASNSNMNLSPAQRELLKWHCRLGHLSMKQTQFLMRTGVLAHSEKTRQLQIQASKSSTHLPMCAACQFAKQRQRSAPGTTKKVVKDRQGVMKADHLLPGQRVSVDHFVCSTKGRLTHTQGKEDPKTQYSGGAIFVDHASGYVFIKEQVHLNTHETIDAKQNFEDHCRDFGVIPQTYLTDNGSAFTSTEYTAHLQNFGQISSFAGVGAHHHNGIAERSIQTVMSLARAMMLHASIHWPEVTDTKLWPLAVQHAVFLYNHVPTEGNSGVSPSDLFTKSRWPHARFHDLHVWGCPVYVLDKKIADGKKLPRWSVRSTRQMYMGVSANHATSVPLCLNLETGAITAQFHVVFDDLFTTVTSDPSQLPDFQSREWNELFGESTHHYVVDDDEDAADDTIYPDLAQDKAAEHRERVEAAFDQLPLRPLEISPPATSFLPKTTQLPAPTAPVEAPFSAKPQGPPVTAYKNPFNMPSAPPMDPVFEQREPAPLPAPIPAPFQERELSPSPSSMQQREPSVSPDYRPTIQREKEAENSVTKIPAPASSTPKRKPPPVPVPTRASTRNRRPPNRLINEINVAESEESFQSYGIGDAPEHFHEMFVGALETHLNNTPTDLNVFKANKINTNPDILTYDQAMKNPTEREHWKRAAQQEIDALIEHETWDEVPMSDAKGKIIPCTWNFRRKRAPDGSFKKYKGRICVRGDLEEEKPSTETYAPVVAWSSVRIFLILSLILQWTTLSIDFNNAFLHAVLKDPIWIHLPRGFVSTKGPGTCLRLKKSLYGSSTSPKLWYDCISEALIKLGFKQTKYDPCFFYKGNMMIVLYVDDAGIAAKDPKLIDELIEQLQGLRFSLTKEGTFAEFLGIKFEQRDNNEFKLTQTGLIDKILKTTKMEDCKPNNLPTSQQALGADSEGLPMQEDWSYPSVVGMLLYLSTNSRPDIAFAVSQVCRFSSNPKQSHATAVKTIIRYLKGTRNEGTIIRPSKRLIVDLFVDADYCSLHGSEDSRSADAAKSRTGYIVTICNCPTIWKSTLQTHISLSTLEAEYSALSFALKAFLPVKWLLEEIVDGLDLPMEVDTTIQARAFEDNQGALILARDQRITNRTKYFLTKWHWFWQHAKEFTLLKVESIKQRADYLTKPLPRDAFVNNRRLVQGW